MRFNALRRHRGVLLQAVLLFILPVLTNLLTSALQAIIGPALRWLILAVAIVGSLAALLYLLHRALAAPPPRHLALDHEKPRRRKGLIALVGRRSLGRDPVADAIEYHLCDVTGKPVLKKCWLIATGGPEGSISVAQEIQETYQKRGVDVHIHRLESGFNLQDAYNLGMQIYEEELDGLEVEDVIGDFTGGTKIMTAGLLLACVSKGALMQYMFGGRADIASEPIEISF